VQLYPWGHAASMHCGWGAKGHEGELWAGTATARRKQGHATASNCRRHSAAGRLCRTGNLNKTQMSYTKI
jgi:hypothetical protein